MNSSNNSSTVANLMLIAGVLGIIIMIAMTLV